MEPTREQEKKKEGGRLPRNASGVPCGQGIQLVSWGSSSCPETLRLDLSESLKTSKVEGWLDGGWVHVPSVEREVQMLPSIRGKSRFAR